MLNKVMLIGNLGKDPVIRATKDGKRVGSLHVATSETFIKNNEKQTITEWHNITLWDKTAVVAEKYLKRGDRVYIEGKIKTEKYEKNGEDKFTTKIICDSMKLLSPKDKISNENSAVPPEEKINWDDIPF